MIGNNLIGLRQHRALTIYFQGGMLFSIGFVSIAFTLFYVFKSSKQITERNREEQADNYLIHSA